MIGNTHWRQFAPALALLGAVGCAAPAARRPSPLTDADRSAIHTLDSGFVAAWVADDTSAVLRRFDSNAVLLPPNSAPVEGIAAIRAYWWPLDGSHTRITSFHRDVSEIAGTAGLAYLRGTATLGWVYRKDGKETSQTSRSTDLVLLAPDASGEWHIVRQMWSQLPP